MNRYYTNYNSPIGMKTYLITGCFKRVLHVHCRKRNTLLAQP